jgi:hypothetical protein
MRTTILLCILQLCVALSATAKVHEMDAEGGGFPSIQAAMDAASEGDTLLLAPGRYAGPGNHDLNPRGKELTVASRDDDPATCLIDCQGSELQPRRGFLIVNGEGPGLVLRGLSITGGWAEEGAGILLRHGSAPRIENCVISGNRASLMGGGLLCHFASPVLEGCVIDGNTAGQRGGGLHLFRSFPLLHHCRVENNGAVEGAGIWSELSSPAIESCSLSANRAEEAGGALAAMGGRPQLASCVLVANEGGGLGGALMVWDEGEPELTGCTISGNGAVLGGGIALRGESVLKLSASILSFSYRGEALHADGGSLAVLTGCDLFGNAGGDWIEALAEQAGEVGNFSVDPGFRDPGQGDYELSDGSRLLERSGLRDDPPGAFQGDNENW